jgi:drug/metabolite transporter (DMT)-like permease
MLAFASTNVLYATFNLVAERLLLQTDALIFCWLQMILLVPVAGLLLARGQKPDTPTLRRGVLAGALLGVGFLCICLALGRVGITTTALFACLDGLSATLVSWLIFRRRILWQTRLACVCAIAGIILLWNTAKMEWQGDLIAFLGGSCFVWYTFLIERWRTEDQLQERAFLLRPFLVPLIISIATTSTLAALCFGDWQKVALLVPGFLPAFCYLSLVATLLPVILSTLAIQQNVSALTAAFLTILEPVASALFAFFLAGERLPLNAYIGGVCVLIGMLIQALVSSDAPQTREKELVSASPAPSARLSARIRISTPITIEGIPGKALIPLLDSSHPP